MKPFLTPNVIKSVTQGMSQNEHLDAHKLSYAGKLKSPPKKEVEPPIKERLIQPPVSSILKFGFSASQPTNVSHDNDKLKPRSLHVDQTRETRLTAKMKHAQSPQSPEHSIPLKKGSIKDNSVPAKTQKTLKTLGIRISGNASRV